MKVTSVSEGAEHMRCHAGTAGHAAVGFLRVSRTPPPSPQTWEEKRALREARMSQVVESASSAGTGMLAATAHAPWEP
jgi:hypothetical protein